MCYANSHEECRFEVPVIHNLRAEGELFGSKIRGGWAVSDLLYLLFGATACIAITNTKHVHNVHSIKCFYFFDGTGNCALVSSERRVEGNHHYPWTRWNCRCTICTAHMWWIRFIFGWMSKLSTYSACRLAIVLPLIRILLQAPNKHRSLPSGAKLGSRSALEPLRLEYLIAAQASKCVYVYRHT